MTKTKGAQTKCIMADLRKFTKQTKINSMKTDRKKSFFV